MNPYRANFSWAVAMYHFLWVTPCSVKWIEHAVAGNVCAVHGDGHFSAASDPVDTNPADE